MWYKVYIRNARSNLSFNCTASKENVNECGGKEQGMKRCVALGMALAVLAVSQSAVAVPTLLETLTVDAQGADVVSVTTLAGGSRYQIEVSGTFSAGADITADAEYSSGPDSFAWQDLVEKYEDEGEGLLELRIDGNFVEWGPFNSNHVYTLDIIGRGSTIVLDIYDIYYPNNSGTLTADIYAVPAPGAFLLASLGLACIRRFRGLHKG